MCCCKKSFAQRGLFWGALFAIFYVLCFIWYFAIKAPALQELYLNLHRLSFVWWNGMDAVSFVSGLVQAFIWGWIVMIAIWAAHQICGCCKGKDEKCETPKA
jgi:hypothetical protein